MHKIKKTTHASSGFTLTELLVSISIIGTLLGILLPVLAIAKAKANRIKCVNNLGQLGKASLAFASDNNERMPWQLTPFAKRAHFGSQDPFSTTAIVSLLAMKSELGTAKILASPTDAEAQGPNETAQAKWETYDARQGRNISCPAVSYRFIEGGNTGRPGTMIAMTRNYSTDDLATGTLVGVDEEKSHSSAVTGLNKGQGQAVFADGSARQISQQAIKDTVRNHKNSSGGIAKGPASTKIIGCCGGGTLFVRANIDDDDILIVTPTYVQWDHHNASRPGANPHDGRLAHFKYTELDGFKWYPQWPNGHNRPYPNDDLTPQLSAKYMTGNYASMLKAGNQLVVKKYKISNNGGAHVAPKIIEQPTSANGFTLKIHFLDKDGHGPELFEVQVGVK